MVDLLSRPSLFLDSSALLASVFAPSKDSPPRKILEMGRVELLNIHVSIDIIREVDQVLTKLDGDFMPVDLAEVLAIANVAVAGTPNTSTVHACMEFTNSKPDAIVLAAAIETNCEVLVVGDKPRLLRNPHIGPPNTLTVIMALTEAMEWARDQVLTRARLNAVDSRKRP